MCTNKRFDLSILSLDGRAVCQGDARRELSLKGTNSSPRRETNEGYSMAFERNISGKWEFVAAVVAVAIVGWLAAACQPASAAEFMFRARVDGRMLEGKPLNWTDQQMLLLGRDGRLYDFNPKLAKEAQKTSPRFFGYSQVGNEDRAAAGIRQAVRRLDDAALSGRPSRRAARSSGPIGLRTFTIASRTTSACAGFR